MNREQFQQNGDTKNVKNSNNEDGDKEYYFDCTILDKLQGGGAVEEIKTDKNIDLMDFISKSDFSTVGGQNNQKN